MNPGKLFNVDTEFDLDELMPRLQAMQAEQAAMQHEALRLIEEAEEDPLKQNYYQRLDTKRMIRTQQELEGCITHEVPIRVVDGVYAAQILDEEDAAKRAKIKKRKTRKAARRSRKRNR